MANPHVYELTIKWNSKSGRFEEIEGEGKEEFEAWLGKNKKLKKQPGEKAYVVKKIRKPQGNLPEVSIEEVECLRVVLTEGSDDYVFSTVGGQVTEPLEYDEAREEQRRILVEEYNKLKNQLSSLQEEIEDKLSD